MAKERILVTGGTGYIGSHTTVELINAGYNVVIIDNLSNSNRDVLDGIQRITGVMPDFVEADCNDVEALTNLFKTYPGIKGIINFAASKAVGESMQKPILYYRNNLNSLMNLLDLMPQFGVKGLVFSSSCTVYGEPDVNPVTEASPIKKATSPYGNTKQICEEIITDVINAGAPFKSVILRYFNPVGAHPSAEIGELPNGVPQNLIPYLTQTAIGIRKELSVFGNDYNTPDGSCIRDFINVVDLAKGHLAAIQGLKPGFAAYNLGTGHPTSVLEMVTAFEKASGQPLPHKFAPRRPGDLPKLYADPSKAEHDLHWHANLTVDDAIKDTLTFLNHK